MTFPGLTDGSAADAGTEMARNPVGITVTDVLVADPAVVRTVTVIVYVVPLVSPVIVQLVAPVVGMPRPARRWRCTR